MLDGSPPTLWKRLREHVQKEDMERFKEAAKQMEHGDLFLEPALIQTIVLRTSGLVLTGLKQYLIPGEEALALMDGKGLP